MPAKAGFPESIFCAIFHNQSYRTSPRAACQNPHFWDGRSAAFGSSAVVPFCFAECLPMPLSGPFPPANLDRRGAESGQQVGMYCARHPARMAVTSTPETTALSESLVRWVPFSAMGAYFVAAQGASQEGRTGTSHLIKAPSAFSRAAEKWESASALSIGVRRLSENRQDGHRR
jgi:hypothetical protein